MKLSNKAPSRGQAMKRLIELFGQRGWVVEVLKPMIEMRQECNLAPPQRFLLRDWTRQSLLPSDQTLGINFDVDIYFEDLENLMNAKLGTDRATYGRRSISLFSNQIVPSSNLYVGLHIVSLNQELFERSVHQVAVDYDEYLEPVRRRLCDPAVFLDDSYVPPGYSRLTWGVWRIAHYYLHVGESQWRQLADRLKGEAEQLSEARPGDDEAMQFVTPNPIALSRKMDILSATQLLRFVKSIEHRSSN